MFPKLHRASGLLHGLRGRRIGEANNPGPASRRRRTQRLRALQRAMDNDSESEDECHNVARRLEGDEQPLQVTPHMDLVPSSPPSKVIQALEADLCCHPRASRRVVLAPQSPGGTPQSVHNRDLGSPTGSSGVSALCPRAFNDLRGCETSGVDSQFAGCSHCARRGHDNVGH